MNRCAVCNRRVIFGGEPPARRVLLQLLFHVLGDAGILRQVFVATTDVSPGNTIIGGLFGSLLVGVADRCATCHSIVQRKWYLLLGIRYGAARSIA
jgi:hypothetical protein